MAGSESFAVLLGSKVNNHERRCSKNAAKVVENGRKGQHCAWDVLHSYRVKQQFFTLMFLDSFARKTADFDRGPEMLLRRYEGALQKYRVLQL
eukprot:2400312-Rhodomonas_salina.1